MSPEFLFFVALCLGAIGVLMWLDDRDADRDDAFRRNHVSRPRKDR